MKKRIDQIYNPPRPHWVGDGFHVHTFFPSGEISIHRMSPFLLLDYNARMNVLPSEKQRGVGVHPHKGFETVTFAFRGKVAHHDSAGNHGIIDEGDVQWMTAGSGVLHKEYYEQEFNRQGGEFQMVQLWVNLPAKDKFASPKYQTLIGSNMKQYKLPGEMGTVKVFAGNYKGVAGSAKTFSRVQLLVLNLIKGASESFELPEADNTSVLILSGSIEVNDRNAEENQLILFKNEGSEIEFHATENTTLLLMSGTPIDEPIAAYGPFVMNTYGQIDQALREFAVGKYGQLEDGL